MLHLLSFADEMFLVNTQLIVPSEVPVRSRTRHSRRPAHAQVLPDSSYCIPLVPALTPTPTNLPSPNQSRLAKNGPRTKH